MRAGVAESRHCSTSSSCRRHQRTTAAIRICAAIQELISASSRWRRDRCRRSVGQPTRGQRWRARADDPRRQALRRDRRARAATRARRRVAPASTSFTSTPVRSCWMTSGRPPESNAMTGVSHSCASTATRPRPSSTDGTTSAVARAIEVGELRLRKRAMPAHTIGDAERLRELASSASRSSPSPTTSSCRRRSECGRARGAAARFPSACSGARRTAGGSHDARRQARRAPSRRASARRSAPARTRPTALRSASQRDTAVTAAECCMHVAERRP